MASTDDLIHALRLRLQFPIGQRTERPEQIGYVEACFAERPDRPIVILPVGYWEGARHKPLRDKLFKGHFPTHVAEIGSIWSPATAIPFQLVLLSKTRPGVVHFAKFEPPATLPKNGYRRVGSFGDLELEMRGAFDPLTGWLQGDLHVGFEMPFDQVNTDRLTVHYHDPEFRDLASNVQSQPFAPLGDLTDVILPRRTGKNGHVVRAKDLREGKTHGDPDGPETNVALRRGDVLVMSVGKFQTFLVDEIAEGATAADHFIVLRCRDERISPEYLVTYLNSDFAWAYSKRHTQGTVTRKLGPESVDSDGWLNFIQEKTGSEVSVPIKRALPKFAEPSDLKHLLTAIEAMPKQEAVWLATAYGNVRSKKGASQWFAAQARKAGLVGLTSHGLRKSRMILHAENGASSKEIAAWSGHETLKEIERYVQGADRRRMLTPSVLETGEFL